MLSRVVFLTVPEIRSPILIAIGFHHLGPFRFTNLLNDNLLGSLGGNPTESLQIQPALPRYRTISRASSFSLPSSRVKMHARKFEILISNHCPAAESIILTTFARLIATRISTSVSYRFLVAVASAVSNASKITPGEYSLSHWIRTLRPTESLYSCSASPMLYQSMLMPTIPWPHTGTVLFTAPI